MIRRFIQTTRLLAASLCALVTIAAAGVGLTLATPLVQTAAASTSSLQGDACAGLSQVGGDCSSQGSDLGPIVKTIVKLLSIVVGIAAIIMVIISGFRYSTSGGDAQKVAAAKSSLIYAIVGLVVAALAQVIVHFVLGNVK